MPITRVEEPKNSSQTSEWRSHPTGGQQPFVTILVCSDSRVPPEVVIDQGFGDLFVLRVAGNIIAEDVVSRIGFAQRHLKTPLVMVMGHQGCGAVTAALAAIDGKCKEPKFIADPPRHVTPGLQQLDPKLSGDARGLIDRQGWPSTIRERHAR